MAEPGVKVTTSDDIFIEVDGKKIAGVESYSSKFNQDIKTHDAFGQKDPIGYSEGSRKYTVDISRMYLEDTAIADGVSFYDLANYNWNLVIAKNGKRTVFKSCIVSDISEDGQLKDKIAERITIMALSRTVE